MRAAAPPQHVREAFGVRAEPAPLPGGRGFAWRIGDLVLKPADLVPDELTWQAEVLSTLQAPDVRLSIPQRAASGELVVDGWTASTYLPGEHRTGRWLEIIDVGDRFHQAVAGLARPAFIDARTHPWAIGDQVAWGEAPIDPYLGVPHIARLAGLRRPVHARSQLIHGDLAGNILFADGLPAAVIDLSLYWRPTAFATAIVVADALVWEGAEGSLIESVVDVEDFGQMLARALLYRLVAAVEGGFEADAEIRERYSGAVDASAKLLEKP